MAALLQASQHALDSQVVGKKARRKGDLTTTKTVALLEVIRES